MAGIKLPQNVDDWHAIVNDRRLEDVTIHAGHYKFSGSNMVLNQFLLFRVLWPETLNWSSDDLGQWPGETVRKKARQYLDSSLAWTAYLKSIDRGWVVGRQLEDLREFSLARQFQIPLDKTSESKFWAQPKVLWEEGPPGPPGRTLQIMTNRGFIATGIARNSESPTPNPGGLGEIEMSFSSSASSEAASEAVSEAASEAASEVLSPQHSMLPDTSMTIEAVKDEELVNMAAIVFLQSLIVHCDAVVCEWSPHRKPFQFKIPGHEKKIYEARVDGYLENMSQGRVCAIVEVKPFARDQPVAAQIRMQEAAQMVAWINDIPPAELDDCRRSGRDMIRLLVSQDRHEIFLTLATFDAAYVDYLRNAPNQQESFLTMREFGPYDVFTMAHMDLLGEILLAFAMEECPAPPGYRP